MTKERLPLETFELPIHKIRRGYYSAVYFWRMKMILEGIDYQYKTLMQIFQKNQAVLCGIDEAIAVIKLCSGHYRDPESAYKLFDSYLNQEKLIRQLRIAPKKNYHELEQALRKLVEFEVNLDELWTNKSEDLEIKALYDSDSIEPWETVMTIDGNPRYFCHLESVYLGILARSTLVATNVAKVKKAAREKGLAFFADRFDRFSNQTADGYAAKMSGAGLVASDSMGEWWGVKGGGTIPHALIACFGGDTVKATLEFAKMYPKVDCISLIDFDNDCPQTALRVADAFRDAG